MKEPTGESSVVENQGASRPIRNFKTDQKTGLDATTQEKWEINMQKLLVTVIAGAAVAAVSTPVFAKCDPGEIVIKFSHVTNTDKHPKGIAASLLQQRVNDEMNGTVCMEVYPNSTLYNDNKVLEALLLGDVQLAAPSLSLTGGTNS